MMADETLVNALQALTAQMTELNQFNQQHQQPSPGFSSSFQTGMSTPQYATSPQADAWQKAADLRNAALGYTPIVSMPASTSKSSSTGGLSGNLFASNPLIVAEQVNNAQGGSQNSQGDDNNSQNIHNMGDVGEVIAANQIGEGGPQFYRNFRLGSYNFKQSIGMAAGVGNWLNPGTLETPLGNPGAVIGNFIQGQFKYDDNGVPTGSFNNPLPFGPSTITPEGLQAASTVAKMVGNIDDYYGTEATVGQTFGYGPGAGGNAFAGFRNPFTDISTAQRVGAAFEQEKGILTGRNFSGSLGTGGGLTSDQAQSILDILGNQGFSMNPAQTGLTGELSGKPTGDAATIANQFMAPLMSQMPGLSADTLSQFTPALRNSGDSAQQLADALADVNTQALATKESVNQFTTSLATAGQSFANMGSNLGASVGTAQQFTEATGLDPQVASQLAQSPIIQGLALGQGVLPSGLGNMGGAFTTTALQAVQLLNSGFKGQDYDQYKTVDGQKFLTRNGRTMESSQIASTLGIPESVVQRMLNEGPRYQHIAAAESLVGNANDPLGIYADYEAHTANGHKMTGAQRDHLNAMWKATVPSLREAGLSHKEIEALDSDKNWRDRLKRVNNDLSKRGGGGSSNKINGGPTTVTINLSAAARKFFNLNGGPSVAVKQANAGGQSKTASMNSIGGLYPSTAVGQLNAEEMYANSSASRAAAHISSMYGDSGA